ncbi:MAG: TauD/TfdA family dioxygenase, partial [Pseudomonadota bacterium]|nr:TauD/TfdA family dioxygenase [Pseudomonadota bacterium]
MGAEIRNYDLSQQLTANELSVVHRAFLENEFLVFRDQDIDARDQITFRRMFGDLSINPFSPNLADMPELIVLDNHQGNPPRLTDQWHSDETFRETPPMATILRSTNMPKLGGDTTFASRSAAYERLSDEIRRLISRLKGIFDFKPIRKLFNNDPE